MGSVSAESKETVQSKLNQANPGYTDSLPECFKDFLKTMLSQQLESHHYLGNSNLLLKHYSTWVLSDQTGWAQFAVINSLVPQPTSSSLKRRSMAPNSRWDASSNTKTLSHLINSSLCCWASLCWATSCFGTLVRITGGWVGRCCVFLFAWFHPGGVEDRGWGASHHYTPIPSSRKKSTLHHSWRHLLPTTTDTGNWFPWTSAFLLHDRVRH